MPDPGLTTLTVTELAQAVRMRLETAFPLLRVEGEISNFSRAPSGHCYFSLKDEQSQVRCVMFRNRFQLLSFKPENGMHVSLRCSVGFYEARGEFQLVVANMTESGDGLLLKRIEALEKKIEEEGLFDVSLKKQLPQMPRQIGVVTSPTGAAIRDVLTTLRRRFPSIPVIVAPTLVQGAQAPGNIVNALRQLDQSGLCDVIILGRGGGSLEDLMAFNDEQVVRCIGDCVTPIVTGIGHETDHSIADRIADQRAATPTAAAEMVSPNRDDFSRRVTALNSKLQFGMTTRITQLSQKLDHLDRQLIGPQQRIAVARETTGLLAARLARAYTQASTQRKQHLDHLVRLLGQQNPNKQIQRYSELNRSNWQRLISAFSRYHDAQSSRLQSRAQQLNALSPLSTLDRGYAIATKTDSSSVITTTSSVDPGDIVDVRLAQGTLRCNVTEVFDTYPDG